MYLRRIGLSQFPICSPQSGGASIFMASLVETASAPIRCVNKARKHLPVENTRSVFKQPYLPSRSGGIGSHARFKIWRGLQPPMGASPTSGTT